MRKIGGQGAAETGHAATRDERYGEGGESENLLTNMTMGLHVAWFPDRQCLSVGCTRALRGRHFRTSGPTLGLPNGRKGPGPPKNKKAQLLGKGSTVGRVGQGIPRHGLTCRVCRVPQDPWGPFLLEERPCVTLSPDAICETRTAKNGCKPKVILPH